MSIPIKHAWSALLKLARFRLCSRLRQATLFRHHNSNRQCSYHSTDLNSTLSKLPGTFVSWWIGSTRRRIQILLLSKPALWLLIFLYSNFPPHVWSCFSDPLVFVCFYVRVLFSLFRAVLYSVNVVIQVTSYLFPLCHSFHMRSDTCLLPELLRAYHFFDHFKLWP